jgi:hypothetical protein
VDACSSSRPSRADVSPSIVPHVLGQRSGSTPHDAAIADPPPHRNAPFRPAFDRRRPHLRRHPRLARNSINRLAQHAVHSFTPVRPPNLRAQPTGPTTAVKPSGAAPRRQFSIEPAAPPAPYPPRFPALALFGRRPPEVRRMGSAIPRCYPRPPTALTRIRSPAGPAAPRAGEI